MDSDIGLALSERLIASAFSEAFDLEGKSVLEVGGCLSIDKVEELKVSHWVSVDPSFAPRKLPNSTHYSTLIQDLSFDTGEFDFIFSANALHLVHDLCKVLSLMRRYVRAGGFFYAHFGPVWSAPDGAQIEGVFSGNNIYNFWEWQLIPSWAHIVWNKDELNKVLAGVLDEDLVSNLRRHIFEVPYSNCICADHYEDCFTKTGWELVKITRSSVCDYTPKRVSWSHPLAEDLVITQRLRKLMPKLKNADFETRDMLCVLRNPQEI